MKKLLFILSIIMVFSFNENSFSQSGRQNMRRGMHGDRMGMMGSGKGMCFGSHSYIKKTLRLNDKQIREVEKINSKYYKRFKELSDKMHPQKNRLHNELLKKKINYNKVRAVLNKISEVEIEVKILRIKQSVDIQKVIKMKK